MKITQENIDDTTAIIKINIKTDDYSEKIDGILKDYRKKSVVPGFRKGKVPMGMIEKQYRIPVLVDEVNKSIQSELYSYITKSKDKFLGSPVPLNKKEVDWNKDKELLFEFEIGLSPDFEMKITKKDKLNYYNIKADDKLIDTYINDITKRYGKMTNPKNSNDGDLVLCEIIQLDIDGNVMNNGIKNESTVSIDFISDQKVKKQFIGLKIGDVLVVDVLSAFENKTDLSSMLNIKSDILDNLTSKDFQFTVKNINRLEPSKINKDLFKKVYPDLDIKSEKKFRSKIKEESEKSFVVESDRMLKNDVVTYLLDKIKFKLPDDFLKRWLVHSSENNLSVDKLEEEYDMYSKSLRWQIIENRLISDNKINVTESEVLEHAKSLIIMQMQQYQQPIPTDDKMSEIIGNILKKDDEKKKVYDQLYDVKTLKIYKEIFKLNEKAISYDDFVKLASEKQ